MKVQEVLIKINNKEGFFILPVNIDFSGRTNPVLRRFCEDGEFYEAHSWTKLNGEIEPYYLILKEALENGLND